MHSSPLRGPDVLRLKSERLLSKARPVVPIEGFKDYESTAKRPQLAADFAELVGCLAKGSPLDERFYRSKIGVTPDRLLEDEGIKHLHLGGRNSNMIVYLIEYADHIALLQIATHSHLESRPPGKNLNAIYSRHLKKLEVGLALAATVAVGRLIGRKRKK